ncbi:septum site-determining protein Ssd [Actinokineospora sp. NBRC 105648]|uniref:septum site-determining protein Ssd n=1 Tax=Actinokineospora sp. NBRC 105648 TaxID=3032206 RepID=UPI0024A15333|nr:septum site-determining protein Ssd [Actinokineospora sp. NBRC 105648]GLZ40977.1 hypothetical protein Acsp05_46010 [Actinokineospora sp. NBRC 105648]
MTRPTVCLRDEALLDDVLRLSAAAGTEPHRAADVTEVRTRWHTAPLVLLDHESALACLAAALPRRAGVVVVSTGPPPTALWETAIALGAERVLSLPADETWLVGALADATEAPAGTAGRVIAVLGGRGGAGASVFAAALALSALDEGTSTLLIDCDPMGGGLDLVLGFEDQPGLRWPDLRLKAGRVPVSSLHSSLPGRTKGSAHLTLLSGARDGDGPAPDAVAAILEAGRRAGETVICDIPRCPDPSSNTALDRADLTVLVVPAELRATAATKRVAAHLATRGIRPALVVRTGSPTRLRPHDIAAAVELPLLATFRPDPALPTALDQGTFQLRPRSPLARAAHKVLHAPTPTHAALTGFPAQVGAQSGFPTQIRAATEAAHSAQPLVAAPLHSSTPTHDETTNRSGVTHLPRVAAIPIDAPTSGPATGVPFRSPVTVLSGPKSPSRAGAPGPGAAETPVRPGTPVASESSLSSGPSPSRAPPP